MTETKLDIYLQTKKEFEELFPEIRIYAFDPGFACMERNPKPGTQTDFELPLWVARLIIDKVKERSI